MKRLLFLFFSCILCPVVLNGQQTILRGRVTDTGGNPVFAANIFLRSKPATGTTCDLSGQFTLPLPTLTDTLVVSFIGYRQEEIPLQRINPAVVLTVVLKTSSRSLQTVIVKGMDPVSDQFAVSVLSRFDIYYNPVAANDPLKAITALPASTTTDESANPSLRGSSADRSRVVLNGVPVLNPVRNSQINGIGNFSIFNTELLHKQYVYPSNPPLTYGNTTAGLIDIQTTRNPDKDQFQLTASLANAGLLLTRRIDSSTFVQAYGNHQFSGGFLPLNRKQLPRLRSFSTTDGGLNIGKEMGKWSANSFSYFIDETYNATMALFAYDGPTRADGRRFFMVNNLAYRSKRGIFSVDNGIDHGRQRFSFGNIRSDKKTRNFYLSANYKHYFSDKLTVQAGSAYDSRLTGMKDSLAQYFYALSPTAPGYYSDTNIIRNSLETHVYASWDFHQKWTLSGGLRGSIPGANRAGYLSYQAGLRYRISDRQKLVLGGGKYHGYSTPDLYNRGSALQSGYQAALDYVYTGDRTQLSAAVYGKSETGERISDFMVAADKIRTWGVEVFLSRQFLQYFSGSISNVFVRQTQETGGTRYTSPGNLNYFVKMAVMYNNPSVITISLAYMTRPGSSFTRITGAVPAPDAGGYIPMFDDGYYNGRYKGYNRLDLGLSRYVRLKKTALVVFANMGNVLNTSNQSQAVYNENYTEVSYDYYQMRTVYFGMVWHW